LEDDSKIAAVIYLNTVNDHFYYYILHPPHIFNDSIFEYKELTSV